MNDQAYFDGEDLFGEVYLLDESAGDGRQGGEPASDAGHAPAGADAAASKGAGTLAERLAALLAAGDGEPDGDGEAGDDDGSQEGYEPAYRTAQPAGSAFSLKNVSPRERRLATSLALLFGKLAEDTVGADVAGDDEWDLDAIMTRRMSGRALPSCRKSRERSRIVLMLDTSPSCSRLAEFYQKISTLAAQYGDVEIYDAPNAYVRQRWNPRRGAWEPLDQHPDDLPLRGRTIVFFGDYDGSHIVAEWSRKNRVYWLNPDHEPGCDMAPGFRGKQTPCRNETDLITRARSMRAMG